MTIKETDIAECLLLEPKVYTDERGSFFESYNQESFDRQLGRTVRFVQDNHSISNKGVLRGLHFQKGPFAQAKLVRVIQGEVLDVVLDIRKNSPTFGKHFKVHLSSENQKMLFIPRGMAHGFLALKEETIFVYKCDQFYNKEAEAGIIYNDPDLGIDWEFPTDQIVLSEKDSLLPSFNALSL